MIYSDELRPLVKDARETINKLRESLKGSNACKRQAALDRMALILRKALPYFVHTLLVARRCFWKIKKLREEVEVLEKRRDECYNEITRYQRSKAKNEIGLYFTAEKEARLSTENKRRQKHLVKAKHKLDKKEQEFIIKQEELEIAIQDTNLAKSSYYHLSDKEIDLFEKQREKILAGVEKYGSISLACKKDPSITMRVSSIMHYAQKHKQFHDDIEIARQVFKDNLDAEILDRALNGTMNPVFQKGEYIGDFPVRDNKLLVEVAKAKLPKEYNPRAYAAAHPQSVGGTTINILSFDGVDETKKGYARNIGVVQSVDDSGKVKRITQSKKMLDFYRKKGGAEIIEAEVIHERKTDEGADSEKTDT